MSTVAPVSQRGIFLLAREAVAEQQAEQNPKELAALASYLVKHEDRRPGGEPNPLRSIVEIGCYRGGLLWFWRKLAPDANIVGVDRFIDCPACRNRLAHKDCPRARCTRNASVFMEAESQEPGTVRAVARQVGLTLETVYGGGVFPEGAGIDLLFIDGDHSAAGIEADFQNYVPMLSAKGVVVIHDVAGPVAAQVNDGQPLDAVQRFWHNVKLAVPQAFEICEADTGGYGVLPKAA